MRKPEAHSVEDMRSRSRGSVGRESAKKTPKQSPPFAERTPVGKHSCHQRSHVNSFRLFFSARLEEKKNNSRSLHTKKKTGKSEAVRSDPLPKKESLLCGRGLCSRLSALAHAVQDALAVLVQLELGDDDFGGVDADGDALAVGLLAGDALDVDDVLEAVDAGDLALTALVGAADNGDLVVFANGYRADLVNTV